MRTVLYLQINLTSVLWSSLRCHCSEVLTMETFITGYSFFLLLLWIKPFGLILNVPVDIKCSSDILYIRSAGQKFGHRYLFKGLSLFSTIFYIVEQYSRHQNYEITHRESCGEQKMRNVFHILGYSKQSLVMGIISYFCNKGGFTNSRLSFQEYFFQYQENICKWFQQLVSLRNQEKLSIHIYLFI